MSQQYYQQNGKLIIFSTYYIQVLLTYVLTSINCFLIKICRNEADIERETVRDGAATDGLPGDDE